MPKVTKRPSSEASLASRDAKRRKPNVITNAANSTTPEAITSARHIQVLLTDLSSPPILQKAYQSFRNFLTECAPEKGGDGTRTEADVVRNKAILREWIESEVNAGGDGERRKNGGKEGKGEAEGDEGENAEKFRTLVQGLGYAVQSSNQYLLSAVASVLALLVRTTSNIPELNTHGADLCKTFLEPANMKMIMRGITAHQERVSSPMLRFLTEINKFNVGELCGACYTAFDFSIKDLGRNLEPKKTATVAPGQVFREDPSRPVLRTVYVRFILSLFQFGTAIVKQGVLEQRAFISPIFKYIKSDTPILVHDILETLKTKAVNDTTIPRVAKTQAFNEWVLGHISALYTRPEPVREDGDQYNTIARCAHEFLIALCTKPGIGGVCFPDNGWYPPGVDTGKQNQRDSEGKKPGHGQKVYNRTLAAFIMTLKPFADTLQQDLLLEIFKAAPELVAGYFVSTSGGGAFTFDPKLTATWIGYCAFLTELVGLPLPKGGFGLEGESPAQLTPPPVTTMIESILPKTCNRQALTRCLAFDNALVKFLSTRFMVTSFNKLNNVITAMEKVAETFTEGSTTAGKWLAAREELAEEFSRRMPDMSAVVVAYNSAPVIKAGGGLQREVASKLLMKYYTLLPEVVVGKRFDVNIALGGFLSGGEGTAEEAKGMRLLEMEHLLGVAKEAGDVKWWNKSAKMSHSSFTLVLKLCINNNPTVPESMSTPSSSSSSKQAKEVLQAVLSQTHIFQQETSADPFDALLESLQHARSSTPDSFNQILTFLDDCLVRCVRTPFKYLDDFAEIAVSVESRLPLSPIVLVLLEQFRFILNSNDVLSGVKLDMVVWLGRFLENLVLCGESPGVILAVLAKKGGIATGNNVAEVAKILRHYEVIINSWVDQSQPKLEAQLVATSSSIRSIFPSPGVVTLDKLHDIMKGISDGNVDITAFDIAVVLRATGILLNLDSGNILQVMGQVMALLEVIISSAKAHRDSNNSLLAKLKTLVSRDEELVSKFLWTSPTSNYKVFEKTYGELLKTLFNDGYENSLDLLVAKTREVLRLWTSSEGWTVIGEKDLSLRVTSKYEILFRHLLPMEQFQDIVSKFTEQYTCSRTISVVAYWLLITMIKCVVEKKIILDEDTLNRLLTVENKGLGEELQVLLAQYISQTEGLRISENVIAKLTKRGIRSLIEGKIDLLCALIGKVEEVQSIAIEYLRDSRHQETADDTGLLRSLFEALSVPSGTLFKWKDTISADTKQILKESFERRKEGMINAGLNNPDVLHSFHRAASLILHLDTKDILRSMLADKQRSNVTPERVSFISSLWPRNFDKGAHRGSSSKRKDWLLMMTDNLTRRFGEESILTQRSISLAKEFSALLKENNVALSEWVPRGSLNALLEAAVEKKIGVDVVVELAAVVASQAGAEALDLTKLLQMILGNSKNLLTSREKATTMIHYHMAYLINRLFTLSPDVHSNISTLDGILLLYRGTCTIVDKLLFDVITSIEGRLTRSCASRISTWTILGEKIDASVASSSIVISRAKRLLAVTIDERVLQQSVAQFAPEGSIMPDRKKLVDFREYLEIVDGQSKRLENQYDPRFMLPVLAYLMAFQGKGVVTPQGIVEKGMVGYAILGLCSEEVSVRSAAVQVLGAAMSIIEESIYRARNQVGHLISVLLASLEESPILEKPIPSVVGVFLAHSVLALADPSHFLYEKLMEMLLRSPFLDIWDIPHLLAILGSEDDYYKEANWKLTVLSQGLRSETDLALYRKRRVFESCMSMYQNPYAGERTRDRIVDLLWNMAEIKGGGGVAVTRNGVVGWVRQVLAGQGGGRELQEGEKVMWKKVVGRLVVTARRGHAKEWSKGRMGRHMAEICRA